MAFRELHSRLAKAWQGVAKSIIADSIVINKFVNDVTSALIHADVDIHLVKGLQERMKKALEADSSRNKRKFLEQLLASELFRLLNPEKKAFQPVKGKRNVVMFVGLFGMGKTTSLAKYAFYYKRKGFGVACIAGDTFRAGAFDQLKQNATKIGVPFYGDYHETDPAKVVEKGLSIFETEKKIDLILIDTSGRHEQDVELFEEMKELVKVGNPDEIVFVLDSSIGQAARKQVEGFQKSVSLGSILLTKLDSQAKGGGALVAAAVTKCPICFIGTGEHVQDLEAFDPAAFVGRLLGKPDTKRLLETMSIPVESKEQRALCDKLMQKGAQFTFRDMYEVLKNLIQTLDDHDGFHVSRRAGLRRKTLSYSTAETASDR